MAAAATPLSSQSMLMAQAGIGGDNRAGGRLLRPRHCLLLPSPHSPHFPAEPGWPGAEQRSQEQLEGGGRRDRAPREGALGPRWEGT